MPLNPNASELISRKGNKKIFIETGTANGDGVQCAIDAGFEKIYSIELNPVLFERCKIRFKDNKNITLICGSSEQKLPEVLEKIEEPFILWLDAHWSGGEYIGELMDVYLPKELNAIKKYFEKFNNSVLMIDDMNHYLSNKNFCDQIEKTVNEIKRTGTLSYCEAYHSTHLVKI
jgi:hypothetical protein